MAYGLSQRFPRPPETFRLLEPGAYQNTNSPIVQPNKVAFLSKSQRKTLDSSKLWTHALYNTHTHSKIPNCTSISSKIPRFPYEAFNAEDLEKILCQCGIEDPCKCPVEEEELLESRENVECQGLARRRLYKGATLRSSLSDEVEKRMFKKHADHSPPFYNAKVIESSAFYQGCKWSKWTSERSQKFSDDRPGPAHYTIDRELSLTAFCEEKVRAHKRKTSKQFRFIEMVQRRNIMDGFPGPANYSVTYPKGTDLKVLGPKAERFLISNYQDQPGPADYSVKRDFTLPEIPLKQCHAKLPPPACFGVKDVRFKPRKEEGPSPASYDATYKPCHVQRCNLAPFGSKRERFKDNFEEDSETDLMIEEQSKEFDKSQNKYQVKQIPTWEFRSKTVRMKPLTKKLNEPSPADLPQSNMKIDRPLEFQRISPFFSSERRLQPWFNFIPVHAKDKTPGPAYYCLEKPKCLPAVSRGPLNRAPRFRIAGFRTPAPNEYTVKGGMEDILETHNHRLKDNIETKHTFHWEAPVVPRKLSLEEQESMLLQQSIALLDVADVFAEVKDEKKKPTHFEERTKKEKLLRCFLYKKEIKKSY